MLCLEQEFSETCRVLLRLMHAHLIGGVYFHAALSLSKQASGKVARDITQDAGYTATLTSPEMGFSAPRRLVKCDCDWMSRRSASDVSCAAAAMVPSLCVRSITCVASPAMTATFIYRALAPTWRFLMYKESGLRLSAFTKQTPGACTQRQG